MTEDFNVVDLVAYAIDQQTSVDITDLRRKQARAAIDKMADILERAIDSDHQFQPDGMTVVQTLRLISRTPSEFLFA
jgi:hypothetical protein